MNIFCKICFLFSLHLQAVVRILTFHYNHPEFIEFQHKTLSHFLTDDFELIVFNDAPTSVGQAEIEEVCQEYQIKCVRFEQSWHKSDPLNFYLMDKLKFIETGNLWYWSSETPIEKIAQHPSVRHCHVIQYALDHFGYGHNDLVAILDADFFLIKPMSFKTLLSSCDFVICSRDPAPFFEERLFSWAPWMALAIFDPSRIPSPGEIKFHVDIVENHPRWPDQTIVDSGGALYRYFLKYPQLKVKEYFWDYSLSFLSKSYSELEKLGFSYHLIRLMHRIQPAVVQLLGDGHFLHFGSISFEEAATTQKIEKFRQFVNDEIASKRAL
jgi:hypothetical protein